jgi:hypothetical protein
MANSRKTTRKPGIITEFPPPESTVGVEDPPESTPQPPEPQPQAATQPPRNPLKKKPAPNAPDGDFFARVAAVPRDDWGSRVFLYLYVLEPLCNLKQSGGKTYLNRYSEPVRDEHQVMMEYGSGRYRLMLSQNKVSPDESNEIARFEFEIYNTQYPPKVPRAAWVNDSRNAKWEALLPKETPPGAVTAASTIVDAMKMVSDIRRDVRDEMDPGEQQPQTSTSDMLATMKAAKDLFAPATAPATTQTATAAKDPLEIATALFTIMNQTKADNPALDLYRDELKAAREEMKEMRAEARAQPATAPSKTFLEQALELASNPDKLEPLKKLASAFGFGGGEPIGRPGRTTGMDILNNLVSGPAGAQLAQGLGHVLMSLPSMFASNPANGMQMPHPPPVVLPAVNPGPSQPETPGQRIQRISEAVTRQMLGEFFMKNATGADFAASMHNFWPEDTVFLQSFGPENLVDRYRRFPQAWAVISYREPDFIQFITEFCAWKPEDDEGPVPPGNGDDGVVDLESTEAEA